jgi:hypothetical protein
VPHPDYLMGLLTPRQLIEWRAFANLEPFGEEAHYWRAGLIAAAAINPHRARGKKAVSPEELMPNIYSRTADAKQSVQQIRDVMVGAMKTTTKKRERDEH